MIFEMLLEWLMDLTISLFEKVFSFFEFPSIPSGVTDFISDAFDYILAGVSFLANFCDLDYLFILLGLMLSIDVLIYTYHFIMWILKKIPVLNIK